MRRIVRPIDGAKLRSLRDEQGYSARQLALKVGISETHIGRIEAGDRQPSPSVRNRILATLGVPYEAIAATAEDTPGEPAEPQPVAA